MSSEAITRNDLAAILNEVLPSVAVDYVVEQGSNYRKWASGKAEFWAKIDSSTGLTTSVWVSPVYYADFSSFSNIWNGVFNASPSSVNCTSNNSQIISVFSFSWTSTGISSLRMLTLNAKSNVSYNFSVYAVGTWK